ncbi:MAG: hypothetical protein JWM27_4146 [Gemmatimonadetes bacterium]|nr:hypothetical protein [Gemmatimonadota bacterium]
MKFRPTITTALVICAALSACAPAARAQNRSVEEILANIEVSYDRAAQIVHASTTNPQLASRIQSLGDEVGQLTIIGSAPHVRDSLLETQWTTIRQLLQSNLDSLAVVVRMPASTPAGVAGFGSLAGQMAGDTLTPFLSAMTARVLRELRPAFRVLGEESERQARFAAVSGLFDTFRYYRGRLLAIAEEACLERSRLCPKIAPLRERPYWGVSASGYSGDLYGIGGFVSISKLVNVESRRTMVGWQLLAQLPKRREWAGEISVGSIYGDFLVMPGVIISPGRGPAVEMSGSVMYLPRSRLSLGLSYAIDHGWGVRAVYGFRPAPVRLVRTVGQVPLR